MMTQHGLRGSDLEESPVRVRLWDRGGVLSEMRNDRGGPRLSVRVLAVVLALLLAGPLTVLLLQGLVALAQRAF